VTSRAPLIVALSLTFRTSAYPKSIACFTLATTLFRVRTAILLKMQWPSQSAVNGDSGGPWRIVPDAETARKGVHNPNASSG
jgi:hypothetical protein